MRVLVLGASGHIGSQIIRRLAEDGFDAVAASRGRIKTGAANSMVLDTKDRSALGLVLRQFDAVVNCVAGDGASIAEGAGALVDAALDTGKPRLIHLSTMAVYGSYEGVATENTPFDSELGWYAAAKCKAEFEMGRYSASGGVAVILRPGCVYGPGSDQWVRRVGDWLRAGRLGDLGVAGDGWSNLVHVQDVCTAVISALRLPLTAGETRAYNLAAPDSPRWNQYFIDLARSVSAVPVRRLTSRQLNLDSKVMSPAIKIGQIILTKMGRQHAFLPDPMPPSLVRFFGQQIKIDSTKATVDLIGNWTPYDQKLKDSTEWFCNVKSINCR